MKKTASWLSLMTDDCNYLNVIVVIKHFQLQRYDITCSSSCTHTATSIIKTQRLTHWSQVGRRWRSRPDPSTKSSSSIWSTALDRTGRLPWRKGSCELIEIECACHCLYVTRNTITNMTLHIYRIPFDKCAFPWTKKASAHNETCIELLCINTAVVSCW